MTPEERQELETLFRNTKAGLTYRNTLQTIAQERPGIRKIFEWGPGASTLFLTELFPEADIYGVEHNEAWMEKCQRLMEILPKVKITHERIDNPKNNGCYVTAPLYLEREFDLMFVDGRLRRDCLGIASLCLAKGGMVVLHDSNRPAYHSAFRFYQPSSIKEDTIILMP